MAASIAVVGIGNELAGDDAAGIDALNRLRELWSRDPRVLLHVLEGDFFEIEEWLPRAPRFLFLDALAGEQPGQVLAASERPSAHAPSFHQTDVGAVMRTLELLGMARPFPEWEIWGVTISPPCRLQTGLSPEVAAGVEELVRLVGDRLRTLLGEPDLRQ